MRELSIILVFAIVTYGIYRLFELFVRRKERMAIIEKLSNGFDPQLFGKQFFLPQFQNAQKINGSWPIRIGMLLVGVGLGVIIASIVELSLGLNSANSFDPRVNGYIANSGYDAIRTLYPACAALFGGLGLVIAYFIERKSSKKDNVEN